MPSSVVARISYTAATQTLRVTYVSGAVYDYIAVPEQIFEAMQKAKSKGTYLNRHIKNAYHFLKIRDADELF